MEAQEKLREIQNLLESMIKEKGELSRDYSKLVEGVLKSDSIPQKYKELIFVSLSLARKCEWCLSYHLKLAIESGATYQELLEVAFITFLMDGSPALMEAIKMNNFYDEFKREK
ncbi:MAG: carboxymuconolactone decarboxylase family protein [Thermoplasmata archaeon]